MPEIGGALAGTFTPIKSTVPTITNLSMPSSGTEYTHAFQASLKQFTIRLRGNAPGILQFAFVSTESGTKYFTVYPGEAYTVEELNVSSLTLYAQSTKASQTLEILEWA